MADPYLAHSMVGIWRDYDLATSSCVELNNSRNEGVSKVYPMTWTRALIPPVYLLDGAGARPREAAAGGPARGKGGGAG